MNPEPLNLIMLMVVIVGSGLLACLFMSPAALERIARKMRARASGLIAAREAYASAHRKSLEDDERAAAHQSRERELFEEMLHGEDR